MDLFLAISQGTGVALATGLRSFLPPLLVGVLARADLGVDFEGSDYAFLESIPFLAVLLLINVAGVLSERLRVRRGLQLSFFGVAVVLGGLLFAGSLSEEGYEGTPGLLAGAAFAALAYAAIQTFLGRARARLAARGEDGSAGYLNLYADGLALVLAALAVLVPPVSYLALAFCAWVLLEHRRRAGRKYEGLRVLR
jgi:uncharacterized protein DUF4126